MTPRRDEPAPAPQPIADPLREADAGSLGPHHDAVLDLLSGIEEAALAIYRMHGLPTRQGEYARSPRSKRWRLVADALTPPERWELYLANAAKPGWRFGQLEDLVRIDTSASPDLLRAADMLKACRELRSRSFEGKPSSRSEDILRAIALGADWHALQMSLEWARTGPLRLSPPRRARPPR